MSNEERKGMWLHKNTGEIFYSLKVFPVVDPEYDKPIELRNERHMRRVNDEEMKEQFVKL